METQNLQGAVAVITGAGGGIGRATAQILAGEGVQLALLGGSHPEKLEKTRELVKDSVRCQLFPGDLTDFSLLKRHAEKIADTFGGVDILINNAGMALSSPFEDVTMEQFDRIMNINVKVPYFLTQNLLPYLEKSGRGTVINIASVVAHSGYPLQSAYAASKHALLGFTKSLAREVYSRNVRVHAICPGGVYTDMVKIARPDLTPEGMIMPEEIARMIWFLLAWRGSGVIDELNVHRVNKEPFLI